MPAEPRAADDWPLTPAEAEVWRLLAEHRSDAEIAEMRVVSIWTVKTQVRSVLRKLEVRTRREAARLYLKSLEPSD